MCQAAWGAREEMPAGRAGPASADGGGMTQAALSAVLAQSGPQVRSRVEEAGEQGAGGHGHKAGRRWLQGETVPGSRPWEQAAAPPWSGKCDGLGSERPGVASL